jgi:indolepyruvate ferredoxin oxidoreductase
VDAVALATALFGDGIAANLIALGAAYQAGALPLRASSISRAIEVNGVAVERNQAAFLAGRLAVHDPAVLPASRRAGALLRETDPARLGAARELARQRGLVDGPAAELAVRRAAELAAYQDTRLAVRYLDLVAAAAQAEASRAGAPGEQDEQAGLAEAVAAGFFHLLAYKDEYEVARLHLLPEFDQALADAVGGGRGVRYLLHPPALRSLGLQRKIAFPAPVIRPAFRALRAMRHVRGTPADPFGYTRVRRTERRLAAGYEAEVRAAASVLSPANHAAAVELARLPLAIRGYEQIKLAAVERYEAELERLRPLLREPGPSLPVT